MEERIGAVATRVISAVRRFIGWAAGRTGMSAGMEGSVGWFGFVLSGEVDGDFCAADGEEKS